MPDQLIHCPQCQRQLRVPDELMGRLVKCPTCATMFTVGAGNVPPPVPPAPVPVEGYAVQQDDANVPPPRPRRQPVNDPDNYYEEDIRDRARAAVIAPAICLIITGALGLASNALALTMNLLRGKEAALAEVKNMNLFKQQGMDRNTLETSWVLSLVMMGGCALISLLVVLGAIQLLRLRTYGLAMAGCIAGMFACYPGCCLLNIPFGIWALVMLARPEVKDAFR